MRMLRQGDLGRGFEGPVAIAAQSGTAARHAAAAHHRRPAVRERGHDARRRGACFADRMGSHAQRARRCAGAAAVSAGLLGGSCADRIGGAQRNAKVVRQSWMQCRCCVRPGGQFARMVAEASTPSHRPHQRTSSNSCVFPSCGRKDAFSLSTPTHLIGLKPWHIILHALNALEPMTFTTLPERSFVLRSPQLCAFLSTNCA